MVYTLIFIQFTTRNMQEQESLQNSISEHSKSQDTSSITSHYSSQSEKSTNSYSDFKVPENQFSINEDAANQILTFYLEPDQSIWMKGQIIASNRPLYKQNQTPFQNFDKLFTGYLKLNRIPAYKITNQSIDLAYYCIRRKGGGGKILFLDQSIYSEKFIFDYNKLLTITSGPEQYTLQNNAKLPNLQKIKMVDNMSNKKVSITLQSNPGSLIMEKSLGMKQKMFLGESSVLAMSQSVTVGQQNRQTYLEGPGYVFLQGKINNPRMKETIRCAIFLQFLIAMVIPFLMTFFLF